jgi:hypothetical protein
MSQASFPDILAFISGRIGGFGSKDSVILSGATRFANANRVAQSKDPYQASVSVGSTYFAVA